MQSQVVRHRVCDLAIDDTRNHPLWHSSRLASLDPCGTLAWYVAVRVHVARIGSEHSYVLSLGRWKVWKHLPFDLTR